MNLKTGKAGSGDNSIIYLTEDGLIGYTGTVPAGNSSFKVSGAMLNAGIAFLHFPEESLAKQYYFTGKQKQHIVFYWSGKYYLLPKNHYSFFFFFSAARQSTTGFKQKASNLYG